MLDYSRLPDDPSVHVANLTAQIVDHVARYFNGDVVSVFLIGSCSEPQPDPSWYQDFDIHFAFRDISLSSQTLDRFRNLLRACTSVKSETCKVETTVRDRHWKMVPDANFSVNIGVHATLLNRADHVRRGAAPWAARGAQLTLSNETGEIGTLAALGERARSGVGLKRVEVVIFTLFLELLQPHPTRENYYVSPPIYQETEKDFSLIFARNVKWRDIVDCLIGVHPLVKDVRFIDAYEGPAIPEGCRSITFRVTLGAEDRTLEGTEINAAGARLLDQLKDALGGTLRS